ncbi:MAG: NUDIX hydrolase [Chlamydiae bacterium]|nr:NUDIX hydrolase [Chlamydiota bacterium]
MQPSDCPHRVKEESIAFQGFFSVKLDILESFSGEIQPYSFLKLAFDATIILPLTIEKKIVFIKEYRHPVKKWLYGLPGGCIDEGEDPIQTARRELLEETGFSARNFVYLGSAYPYPSISNQKLHFVLAEDAYKVQKTSLTPFEHIIPLEKTKEDLLEDIVSGQEMDGILFTALAFLSAHHQKQKNH